MRRFLMLVAVLALTATACSGGADDGSGGSGSADAAAPGGGGAVLAQQGAQAPSATTTQEGIRVTGQGQVRGRPDTLRATVGVEVQRDSVQEALNVANERAGAVIDAVIGAGVPEENTQTQDVSVQPMHDRSGDGSPEITGYRVSNMITIRVPDPSTAGEVLSAAVEAGGDAARVHGVRFALEDNEELLSAARQAAFENARSKAQSYAEFAGRSLGELVSITEEVSTAPQPVAADDLARESAGASVPVQPGQEEVSVTVTAVWSLG